MLLYVNPQLFIIKFAIIVMYQNMYSLHKRSTTSRASTFIHIIIKEAIMTPKHANSKLCWGMYCTYTNIMYVQYIAKAIILILIIIMFSYPVWIFIYKKYYTCICDIKFVSNPCVYTYWTTNGHTLITIKEVCCFI